VHDNLSYRIVHRGLSFILLLMGLWLFGLVCLM